MIIITERGTNLNIQVTDVPGSINVYKAKMINSLLDNKEFLGVITNGSFDFEIENSTARNYYIFMFEDGHSEILTDRYIDLDGTHNLRDFGGYETSDGRHVKWGVFYRSDQLSELTDRDVMRLESMNIRTVVDFRSKLEASNFPNILVGNSHTVSLDPNASTAQLAAGSLDVQEKKNMSTIELLKNGTFDPKIYGDPQENMLKEYRKFSTSDEAIQAYKTYIHLALNPENTPLLQHCRGGKDRTGFGVAILLLILGVSEEDIISDYELSTYYKKTRNEKQMDKYRALTDDEEILNLLYTMQLSKAEYMEMALDQIKKIYGSYEYYFSNVLELSENDIKKLKNLYTY